MSRTYFFRKAARARTNSCWLTSFTVTPGICMMQKENLCTTEDEDQQSTVWYVTDLSFLRKVTGRDSSFKLIFRRNTRSNPHFELVRRHVRFASIDSQTPQVLDTGKCETLTIRANGEHVNNRRKIVGSWKYTPLTGTATVASSC